MWKPSIKPYEIYHHGILGQKWGVRNGPPYPLDSDFKLKKNKKFRRISRSQDDSTKGHKYLTNNSVDEAFYKAFIGKGNSTYTHTYRANKDLNMAGAKTVRATQQKILDSLSPEKKKKLLKEIDDTNKKYVFKNRSNIPEEDIKKAESCEKDYKQFLKDYDKYGPGAAAKYTPEQYKRIELGSKYNAGQQGVKMYMERIQNKSLSEVDRFTLAIGGAKEARSILFKALTEKGYDGMLDVAGVGSMRDDSGKITREGISPLIVFNSDDLSYVGAKRNNVADQGAAYRYYQKEINKARRRNEINW